MFFFGHLGPGAQMVLRWRPRLPWRWVLVGTLLPDLVDKPIFYATAAICGRESAAIHFLGCTRNFGHTAIFLAAVLALAAWRRSDPLLSLGLGTVTHDLLDWVEDLTRFSHETSSEGLAFFWPLSGHFGYYGPPDAAAHLMSFVHPYMFVTETIGLVLFILFWRRLRSDPPHRTP